jgi:hypothetical protein
MSRVFGVVRSPYSLEQVLKTGNSARDEHFTDVSNILFSDGGNYQNDTAIISNDITTLFTEINTIRSCGSFYKTSNQFVPSGINIITWDASESWSDSGYIDISGGAGGNTLVVQTAGVYELTAHAFVSPNSQTWTSGANSSVNIRIERPPAGFESIFTGLANPVTTTFYSVFSTGIIKLEVGDLINTVLNKTLTSGGNINITGTSAGIDRNTFFQFRYIKP